MQTVPSEFVCQLRPLMFVAGLGGAEQQDVPTSSSASASAPSSSGTLSFQQLTLSLREVFTSRKGYPIYDNLSAKRKADYNVILVEKNVRFPPRKARLQNGQGGAHSPISPFTPTSPLYPDGLIAPIWIRKHRELIPSVFVLVLRLYEFGAPLDDGTPDTAELDIGPLEKEKVERLRDNELVNEVMNRKRTCNERGIKLAVVLLASRELLDDPALDTRLSHIRRLSGLDSRASLFVLSPVPSKEVQNFVKSLQNELLESSIDYYREHGRRLRRKRARPAGSNNSVSINSSTQLERNGTGSPHATLNNAALNVRYEFKAATFAQFRAEVEVALKHYEDCYNALLDLFVNPASGSNQHPFILARTKRWAEARVLADCIVVKICKMYMYSGNAEYAVSTYHEHVRRLSRISAAKWSMGDTTFEYWSWESKQHRTFGDLLEAAMGAGFQIPPIPGPTPGPPLQARASAQHIPAHVLQHPGAYYFRAGSAAEQRYTLFRRALEEYEASYSRAMTDPSVEELPKLSAALAHEKSAPHAEHIIELYTKAYDHYKMAKGVRMTLCLAYLIAKVHHRTQALETALRFDERIIKTYRRERWRGILETILSQDDLALRKQLSDTGSSKQSGIESPLTAREGDGKKSDKGIIESLREALKIGFERASLCQQSLLDTERRPSISDVLGPLFTLLATLPAPAGSGMDARVLNIQSSETHLPFRLYCAFWRNRAELGTLVPLQVSFQSQVASDNSLDGVRFESIEVHFSDMRSPLIVKNDQSIQSATVTFQPEQFEGSGNVRSILCQGALICNLTSPHAQSISVTAVIVMMTVGDYRIYMTLHPASVKSGASQRIHWLVQGGESGGVREIIPTYVDDRLSESCSFEPRKARLHLDARASHTAYLDETYSLELLVTNNDNVDMSLYLDALLHPFVHGDSFSNDTAGDYIQLEGGQEKARSLSNALFMEVLAPGKSVKRTLSFSAVGMPGERTLDISIVAKPATKHEHDTQIAVTELTKQISLDVVHPFFCDFCPIWYRANFTVPSKDPSILSLETPDIEDIGYRLLLEVTLGSLGPEALRVRNVSLHLSESTPQIRLISNALEDSDILDQAWEPRDPFRLTYELLLGQGGELQSEGTLDIFWTRLPDGSDAGQSVTTRIHLPQLLPPPLAISPQILAYQPSSAVLHKPFKVQYALECPVDWAPAPIQLMFQMESGSENFVFSGPRKTQRTLILHEPESGPHQIAEFTLVPMGSTGLISLPRFRCWHILETPMQHSQRIQALEQEYMDHETGQSRLNEEDTRIRLRELKIVEAAHEIIVPSHDQEDAAPLQQALSYIYVVPR